jgi:2OG-Fe(II) oxygenase superfamily
MNNYDNVIKYTEDIYGFENFLTKEECDAVLSIVNEQVVLGLQQWQGISFYESFTIGYPSENHPLFNKYNLSGNFFQELQKGYQKATSILSGVDLEKISNLGLHIQRWDPGSYAHWHSDNSDNDGNLGAFERSRYAAFLYLNENFEGGEIEFKDKDLKIKPRTGLLMVFHGGHKNMHKVNTVTKGHRYTIGSFWDDRAYEDYPEEKRKFWEEQLEKDRAAQKEEIKQWEEIRNEGFRLSPEGVKYRYEGESVGQ